MPFSVSGDEVQSRKRHASTRACRVADVASRAVLPVLAARAARWSLDPWAVAPEDRRGIERWHRYGLPDGTEAVADMVFAEGAAVRREPYRWWMLVCGERTWTVRLGGGVHAGRPGSEAPGALCQSDALVDLGLEPACSECPRWPFDPLRGHSA